MKPLYGLAIGLGLLSLAGCATTNPLSRVISAYGALTDASVPASTVIIAANGFDAVEVTGKNIVIACTPVQRPAACDDVTLRKLIAAVKAGRNARDGLEGFLANHPGQLGSKGLYDALVAATGTITSTIDTYHANGG